MKKNYLFDFKNLDVFKNDFFLQIKNILFALLFINIFQLKAQTGNKNNITNNCDALVKYRDEILILKYDKIAKDYSVKKDNLNWIIAMKQEAKDESKWAASNSVGILKYINTICNGIQNAFAIASPQGNILNLAKKIHDVDQIKRKEKYFNTFSKSIENIENLMAEDIEQELIKGALVKETGTIGAIYSFFDDAKKDLKDIKDWKQLRIDVNNQLLMFEKSIIVYQEKYDSELKKLDQINRYNNYIAEYLNEYCKKSNNIIDSKASAKNESIGDKKLLATYKEDGKWIAMGPYMTTEGFPSEKEALESLFYTESDITFLCQREKYKIYTLNEKVKHDARDIRAYLKSIGINDIPE